jgi:hypothetical protein
LSSTIKILRGVAANLPTLEAGQFAFTTDTHKVHIGDGAANHALAMAEGQTFTGAIVTADHGTATNPEVVAVVYGTGSPPTANTTPIGTLFMQYTA